MQLSSLIQRSYMKASLMPLLLIEVALIVMYFAMNSYFSTRVADTFTEEVTVHADQIISKEVAIIGSQLDDVMHHAYMLQKEHEELFRNPVYKAHGEKPEFGFHRNGVFYKLNDNGGSSLYYSSDVEIGKAEKEKAYFTESLDANFKNLVDTNDLIAQVYLNTWDKMNRLYPYIPDVPDVFGPTITMDGFDFYTLADGEHDPERKPVWTTAYLDPAGMGWLISCIVPIYNGDFMEGVTGLDITVQNFIDNILNLNMNMSDRFSAFMVDRSGMILAMDERVEKMFRLKELKEHAYEKKVNSMIFKPEEYNLLKHPDPVIREKLGGMFTENFQNYYVNLGEKDYFVIRKTVPQTGWHLFVIIDMASMLAPITELDHLSAKIGILAVAGMLGFYIIFAVYFSRQASALSEMICSPISRLTDSTKYIGTGFLCVDYEESDIDEINQLNSNFDEMNRQLEKRTQELVRTEVEKLEKEQEAERLLIVSITDPLTGLNNRLKVDEILDYELIQSKRYKRDLSVIILDLDHFKSVNDSYGHQTGDRVLVQFSRILEDNTRNSDTVARWGGEEFLIVCSNTPEDEAYAIAEKLRCAIAKHDFGLDRKITASFGVAGLVGEESKESLISRADEALYKAKELSRNTVVRAC